MGDVSWKVPTGGFIAATWVPGTPPHSWQAVAAGGMSIGQKGMTLAASTLALTAIKLLAEPQLIKQAKAEFDERSSATTYETLLGDRSPALDYRD